MRDDEAAFVDAMGQLMSGFGLGPMAGRVWAWLLIAAPRGEPPTAFSGPSGEPRAFTGVRESSHRRESSGPTGEYSTVLLRRPPRSFGSGLPGR